jgi:preprotein translocase subunit SecY
MVYVMMGGLSPGTHVNLATGAIFSPSVAEIQAGLPAEVQALAISSIFMLKMGLIFQLFLGGMLILFMDEVISKWGFGSGVSLFIAAGVSAEIFVRALSPFVPEGADYATGAIPALFQALSARDPLTVGLMLGSLATTALVFVIAVYAQSMKVEIPLSFGRIRGHGIRWPLSFIYTSNIPVILVAALMANVQLFARILQSWGYPILGTFIGNTPASGIVVWLHSPDILGKVIKGTIVGSDILHAMVYILFMIVGAVIFSWFWVQTSGMDARSQAKQIMASGLQIPGFRKDQRVLERLLNRYIGPLTIMGAVTVGFLAAFADLTGALSRGTGILLAVMIIYRLYEDIAKQHMMDMNPMMRKFMGG